MRVARQPVTRRNGLQKTAPLVCGTFF